MTPAQLRAFVQVCQTGAFGEAAEQLHMSQPALSIAIKKLEESLGGSLFDRSTRQLQLTPEGRAFLPMAKRLVKEWRTVKDDVSRLFSLQQGVLVIAAMPSFANSLLPGILSAFHASYPNIRVRIHDVIMEDALDMVSAGQAEMAFTFAPLEGSGLSFQPLFDEHFTVLIPKATEYKGLSNKTIQDILTRPMITLNRGSSLRRWIDDMVNNEGIRANIVAEVNQLSTLGRLVQEEVGIGIVPSICVPWLQQQALDTRTLPATTMTKAIGVVSRNRSRLSTAANALMEQVYRRDWSTTSS